MEWLSLYHFLSLLLITIVSIVGGAIKSKAAKKPPPKKTIENVECGIAPVSYSSEGDLNLSNDLENDLSDSRINSWDEDYTTIKNDHATKEDREEESAEDYTEDYPDIALKKADRILLKGYVEKCVKGEMHDGDKGVMKTLKKVSSDTYLTQYERSLDCDSPENAGTEAKIKFKEMMDKLPFRPIFTLDDKSITSKNYKEVFKSMTICHKEPKRQAMGKLKRKDYRENIEKTYKGKHVKFDENALAFIVYGTDEVRGKNNGEDEPDTVDCLDGEEKKNHH